MSEDLNRGELTVLISGLQQDMHVSDGTEECAGWDMDAIRQINSNIVDFIIKRENDIRSALANAEKALDKIHITVFEALKVRNFTVQDCMNIESSAKESLAELRRVSGPCLYKHQ